MRKKHREVHGMCQDTEDTEVSPEKIAIVGAKVFNFHSIQSVIIAKVKETSQMNYANIRSPITMAM